MKTFAGIDYGSKLAGTTVICYKTEGRLTFRQSEKKKDADAFIEQQLQALNLEVVFIDAPLSLPMVYQNPMQGDDFFYRTCDRDLQAMSPMFLGGLTARAMKLRHRNASIEFYEAYPAALARNLEINSLGYKKDKQHIHMLAEKLQQFYSLEFETMPQNWHQFDALLAYLIGLRFERGEAESFGNPDEGLVWV